MDLPLLYESTVHNKFSNIDFAESILWRLTGQNVRRIDYRPRRRKLQCMWVFI